MTTQPGERRGQVLRPLLITVAGLAVSAAVFFLLWKGPWWLDGIQPGVLGKDDGPRATVVSGLRTAIVALFVAMAGIGGLIFTARTLRVTQATLAHTQAKDRAQEELTREGQVTDRYVKAVGLLTDDTATARLAGVYALQRIMRDSEKDHDTIVQLLAGFIRGHSPLHGPGAPRESIPSDVQAALTVLATRPTRPEADRIDLSRTDLGGAELATARLDGATFVGSRLDKASLTGAHFQGANFWQASMRQIVADGADFSRAQLLEADLGIADLTSANLTEAILRQADLRSSHLRNANLAGADLTEAQLMDPDGTKIAIADGPAQFLTARVTGGTLLHRSFTSDPALAKHIEQCDKEFLGG
ncbi:pentapeptide repeat-containing protein [Kitasatospora sp. NPDC048365]|uniref:pentapeptide repeat-containing protein n=1 Tax=Kitasatospora sp. NPDC048365 TaxID=3364050 RepID=UPI003711B9AB